MKRFILPAVCVVLMAACGNKEVQPESILSSAASEDQITSSNNQNFGQESISDSESVPNILQVALGSKDHTTLVAAVKAAGQETALANNGPLTVFAPVNAAFDALPEGAVEDLLKPENKMQLIGVIQLHAAPGTYDVDQLKDGQSLFVASGQNITVEKKGADTFVHGAKILGTVKASNGLVHVVDKVLLPN